MSNSAQLTLSPNSRSSKAANSAETSFIPTKSARVHTPYDHPYFFLCQSNNASDELVPTFEGETLRPWLPPRASRNSIKSAPSEVKDCAALPQLDLRPHEHDETRNLRNRVMSARVLQVMPKQELSYATKDFNHTESPKLFLDRFGNWPIYGEARYMFELEKLWQAEEWRRMQAAEAARRALEARQREAERIAQRRREYQEWLESRSFAVEYGNHLLGFPKRLTKKELIKLREMTYITTIKKVLRGFPHLREAFKCPPEVPGRDLECLHELDHYASFLITASGLYKTLRASEIKCSEVEAALILEVKLKIPVDSVMAIVEHTEACTGAPTSTASVPSTTKTEKPPTAPETGGKKKEKAIPHPALRCYDPFITFEDFCRKVLPRVDEIFQLLRKEERERLKHEFQKREKEEKMGAVWERIKKRRLETKHDMDVALCVIQEGVREIEEKQLNILKKILQAASKYWDPVTRKKYETKLKEEVVLIDIKATMSRCIMEGVSLGGLKPKDLATIIQNYGAIRMQAMTRCFLRYKKFNGANKMYRHRVDSLMRTVFYEMKFILIKMVNTKKYCRRVVYRWRQWVRRRSKLLQTFQVAFWPFHVWKRYTIKRLYTQDKAKFLYHVYRVYIKLRAFKAIQRFVILLKEGKAGGRRLRLKVDGDQWRTLLQKWGRYSRRRRRIREAWEKRGKEMRNNNRKSLIGNYLVVWRYTSRLARETQLRACLQFRSGFLDLVQYKVRLLEEEEADNQRFKNLSIVDQMKEKKDKRTAEEKETKRRIKMLAEGKDLLSLPSTLSLPRTPWEFTRTASPLPYKMKPVPMPWELGPKAVEPWTERQELLCRLVHQRYCQKDRRNVCVSYLRYKRLGPNALACLKYYAAGKKKKRYAMIHAALRLQRKVFRAIYQVIKDGKRQEANPETVQQENARIREERISQLGMMPLARDKVVRDQEYMTSFEVCVRTKRLVARGSETGEQIKRLINDFSLVKMNLALQSQKVLDKETICTKEAEMEVLSWASNFSIHAIETFVHVLERMQGSLLRYENRDKIKDAFKAMRMLYMEGKIEGIHNYFKLRRWLKICHRYRQLLDGMPRFYRLKRKYLAYERWLKYLEILRKHRSPGILEEYRKRSHLGSFYSVYLKEKQLIVKAYQYQFLNPLCCDAKSVFLRWVFYTQRRIAYAKLTKNARKVKSLRLVRRVLETWRMGMSTVRTEEMRRERGQPFMIKRALTDMSVVVMTCCTKWRKDHFQKIRVANAKRKRSVQLEGHTLSSFKRAMIECKGQLNMRYRLERTLLFEAFEDRGTMKYEDFNLYPCLGVNKDGVGVQYDMPSIPESHIITKVSVFSKFQRGITGIRFTTSPGEFAHSIVEGPHCGYLEGKCDILEIGSTERIVGIELLHGIVLEQIRFKLLSGQVSQWLGQPINPALANHEELNIENDEEFIVGFHGIKDSIRLSSIGLKVRSIYEENIFTYNWVESKAEDAPLPGTDSTCRSLREVPEMDNTDLSINAPGMGSPEQELVALMAMRHVDISEAIDRAVNFGKRLWDLNLMSPEYSHLSRASIIIPLVKWFFSAISHKLVNIPPEKDEAERMIKEGRKLKLQGAACISKADKIRYEAGEMRTAPRPWATTGILGPRERQQENNYQVSIRKLMDGAKDVEKEGKVMIRRGKEMIQQGKSMLPTICCDAMSRAYYRRFFQLIQSQNKLHKAFPGDAFKKFVLFGVREGKVENKKTRPANENNFDKPLSGRVFVDKTAETVKNATSFLKLSKAA